MALDKVHVGTLAKDLEKPFLMLQIATIDDLSAFLYLSSGFVARHRHLSQDELFYVCAGMLNFDTDWGRLALSDDELTVIPRGLSHLSGAVVRTIVMRFAAPSETNRKNGHGRVLADPEGALPKRSLPREDHILRPNLPLPVATVDDMSLRFVSAVGETDWHRHAEHDELVWVREGAVTIGGEAGSTPLGYDEVAVVPGGMIHRIEARDRAWVVSLIHDDVSPQAHMGLEGETGLE
jgi:homogentisate 1,2-dioxygenase